MKRTLFFYFDCLVFAAIVYILTKIFASFGIGFNWYVVIASLIIFTTGKMIIRRLANNNQSMHINKDELS